MAPSRWPYPEFGSPSWLSGGADSDPVLSQVRHAVMDTVARAPSSLSHDERLLVALAVLAEMSERIDWALLAVVGEARARGTSWAVIGEAIGVSKQAAHKRFSPYVEEALAQAESVAATTH